MKQNANQKQVNAALKVALKKARANGSKLTQEKALIIALATISNLFDADGKPIKLGEGQMDVLGVLFYPKTEMRLCVLENILKAANCTLDDTTKALLLPLFSPANLDKKLSAVKEAPVVDWNAMVADDEEEDEDTATGEAEEETATTENAAADEEEVPVPVAAKPVQAGVTKKPVVAAK